MTLLLGIDFGTSNVKAAVYDARGQARAVAACPTPVASERRGRAVYPPAEIRAAVVRVVRESLRALPPPRAIAGVATTSVGESVVPLDADGEPLAPALAWYDERTLPFARPWSAPEVAADLFRLTGLEVDSIFSAFKVMWFKQEHPELYRRVRHWLPVGDYVNFLLTGKAAVSSSLASRTMLLDLSRRRWSEDLMREFRLEPGQWPEVVDAGVPLGGVTRQAAEATGLAAGTPVVAGGHDHVCGALAVGVYEPGTVLDSMGTTEAIFAPLAQLPLSGQVRRRGYSLGCHVAPNRYYAINGILGSGGLVGWLRRAFWGAVDDDAEAFAQLERSAAASPEGARGVVVLPYFAGPGLAHPEPEIAGAILGLSLESCAGDVARAALEGLSFEVRILLEDLALLTGAPLHALRLIGGASRNALWRRLKADITGLALSTPQVVEAGCLGCALLAGLGTGLYRDVAHAVASVERPARQELPDLDAHRRYQAVFNRFLDLRTEAGPLGRRTRADAGELP